MYAAYTGPLYAVRRLTDNATLDILPLGAGGVANAAAQDRYCAALGCSIAVIYDQSPLGNHLRAAPGRRGARDLEVNASIDPLTLNGNKVYAAFVRHAKDTTSLIRSRLSRDLVAGERASERASEERQRARARARGRARDG